VFESIVIFLHAVCAFVSFLLGTYVLLNPKGTPRHMQIGRIYLGLMVFVSLSALFIREIDDNSYSVIHILIPLTLALLAISIFSIRRFRITRGSKLLMRHKITMIFTYVGGLVIAGAFTLAPGRILHRLIF
jgi:uncharacterized membrane protein